MNIFVSGFNHKTVPLEVREKLDFTSEEKRHALSFFRERLNIDECVMLCTCNRTEVYVCSANENFKPGHLEDLICELKELNVHEYRRYFNFYSGTKAVNHLFRVACGLDSLVLGEDQILGQVKEAHQMALESGTSLVVLNTLFRDAIAAAKKIKTHAGISRNPVSVASMAVKLISDIFDGRLYDKTALIIGAGRMGAAAIESLQERNIKKIYITKRAHGSNAFEEMIDKHKNIYAIDYNDRYRFIRMCEFVISATSSPHYTITRDALVKTLNDKHKRVFMDIAVPRDIDGTIGDIEGITYFNIDDIGLSTEHDLGNIEYQILKAERMIEESVIGFEKWFDFNDALPTIKEIQKFAERLLTHKIGYTIEKLKSSPGQEKEIVETAMTGMVNEMLNKLVYSVRDRGTKEDIQAYFKCLKENIFYD